MSLFIWLLHMFTQCKNIFLFFGAFTIWYKFFWNSSFSIHSLDGFNIRRHNIKLQWFLRFSQHWSRPWLVGVISSPATIQFKYFSRKINNAYCNQSTPHTAQWCNTRFLMISYPIQSYDRRKKYHVNWNLSDINGTICCVTYWHLGAMWTFTIFPRYGHLFFHHCI